MIRRPPGSTRPDTTFPTRRSSDLQVSGGNGEGHVGLALVAADVLDDHIDVDPGGGERAKDVGDRAGLVGDAGDDDLRFILVVRDAGDQLRSEEHTSELQSLMSISYAVFCLKKKKQNNHHSN